MTVFQCNLFPLYAFVCYFVQKASPDTQGLPQNSKGEDATPKPPCPRPTPTEWLAHGQNVNGGNRLHRTGRKARKLCPLFLLSWDPAQAEGGPGSFPAPSSQVSVWHLPISTGCCLPRSEPTEASRPVQPLGSRIVSVPAVSSSPSVPRSTDATGRSVCFGQYLQVTPASV